jgi:hypothetical protein
MVRLASGAASILDAYFMDAEEKIGATEDDALSGEAEGDVTAEESSDSEAALQEERELETV